MSLKTSLLNEESKRRFAKFIKQNFEECARLRKSRSTCSGILGIGISAIEYIETFENPHLKIYSARL
jgi:hypothetical protein